MAERNPKPPDFDEMRLKSDDPRGKVLGAEPAREGAPHGCGEIRSSLKENGAGEAIRTPDPNLGKVVLYP